MKHILSKTRRVTKGALTRFAAPFGLGHIKIESGGFWTVRYPPTKSLKTAARLFEESGGSTIVEVGSGLHGATAGNSILVWARQTSAKRIIAIDLDEKLMEKVRRAVASYPNVEVVVADAFDYLDAYDGSIDLLYLDFWVPDAPGEIKGTGRAEAYLRAYGLVRDKLSRQSMILIDDTDHVDPWKQTLIVPEARRDGYDVVHVGRQTLLRRPARAARANVGV